MHVSRKTNTELALVDSSIWVSVLLLCAAVPVVYISIAHGRQSGLWVTGFFVLCAFLFWRKEVVVFDAAKQQATWWRRRAFKAARGMIAFSEIKGIGIEASAAAEHGTLTYRLTILTSDKTVPMSDVYAGNRPHYEALKAEISEFLHVENVEMPDAGVDENSIQSLLKQGRKVDAIELVRASQKIGLTEAVDLVNGIEEKMKAAK
ncbi:MAG: hypothetical protein WA354_09520 [Terracidiphilus sp.]